MRLNLSLDPMSMHREWIDVELTRSDDRLLHYRVVLFVNDVAVRTATVETAKIGTSTWLLAAKTICALGYAPRLCDGNGRQHVEQVRT